MTTASDLATAEQRVLVIIESPCAPTAEHTADDHIFYLDDALLDSLQRGEAPIASHGLFAFSMVLDDEKPEERELGTIAGLAWYRVAQRIVIYQDLGISPGMERGIALAASLGIPVEYRNIK